MIRLENNKEINNCLEKLEKTIIEEERNFSKLARKYKVSDNLDSLLLAYYKNLGFKDYQLQVSHKLITDMPFNKNINLDFIKKSPNYKTYTIYKDRYEPTDYAVCDNYGRSYVPLVRFDKDIVLPMICEDNIGWITPVLFEETTMRPCVNKAHGNVLVVGLGIGFFIYNCLLKDEVKKITVIEYNQDIIDLFKENILPQFNRKEDIEIIKADAFKVLDTELISKYDYTFVDIWRNDSDGTEMLSNLLKNIDLDRDLNIDFWIENTILENVKIGLRIYLIMLGKGRLEKCLKEAAINNNTEKDFITFSKIRKYFLDKNIEIKSESELIEFINDKKMLRDLLKSF